MVDATGGELDTPISLDTTLDDIEDLPTFVVPLSGAYVFKSSWEQKDIPNAKGGKDHPAVSVNFEIVEITELSEEPDEGEAPPKVGDKFSIPYMLDNKFGAGMLKSQILVPTQKHFGGATKTEVLNNLNGATVVTIIKRQYNKKSDRYFPNIKKLAFV